MQRNITLDYFKLICAFLVITIHSSIAENGFGGWAVEHGIARIAVPCFFVINGYFLFPVMKDRKKFGNFIVHLILIYIVWSLIYFNYSFTWLRSFKKIIWMFFSAGYFHLWYLVSLIYASILLFFIRKLKTGFLLILSVVLYYTGFFLLRTEQLGFDISFNLEDSRNFLFMGFPFLCAGYCINKLQLEKRKVNVRIMILALAFFAVCLFGEIYYQYFHSLKSAHSPVVFHADFYISLIFLCPLLVLTILKTGKYAVADGYISKLASGVYFGHILVLVIVRTIWGGNDLYNLPLIFFLSVILSAGIIAANKRLKIFL